MKTRQPAQPQKQAPAPVSTVAPRKYRYRTIEARPLENRPIVINVWGIKRTEVAATWR
jgi:hypothetical protein